MTELIKLEDITVQNRILNELTVLSNLLDGLSTSVAIHKDVNEKCRHAVLTLSDNIPRLERTKSVVDEIVNGILFKA